jgi:hypothetical protein
MNEIRRRLSGGRCRPYRTEQIYLSALRLRARAFRRTRIDEGNHAAWLHERTMPPWRWRPGTSI